MNPSTVIIATITTILVCGVVLLATPFVFAGRVLPGIRVAGEHLGGTSLANTDGVITMIEERLLGQVEEVTLRSHNQTLSLQQLGVVFDHQAVKQLVTDISKNGYYPTGKNISPFVTINDTAARATLHQRFADILQLPTNASLRVEANNSLTLIPSHAGEQIDTKLLQTDIQHSLASDTLTPIELVAVSAPAPIQDNEVEFARLLTQKILREGIQLHYADKTFDLKPFTLKRLIQFQEQPDPLHSNNEILGVALNSTGLKEYFTTTLKNEINRPPINARFQIADGRVEQFAVPETGLLLNFDSSTQAINAALSQGQTSADLIVDALQPDIRDTANIQNLGVTTLIASGETDFRGSPKNRIFNIGVGTAKYNGLLIPPGTEFSFLSYLGPVDGEHGFKPELVIKENVTKPEFGGGLCQVSTTAFRAAIEAGLKITERHNHSYAVRYYGQPGFDATIYPPYTDLRFLNNTPAYILIQTKIEGTKLTFEFWGTNDGRTVTIDGPHPFNRQPDGAVKATLGQTVVTKDGENSIDDTFRSNYKSPNLFPHVLAANGEKPPAPAPVQPNVPNTTTPAPTKAP